MRRYITPDDYERAKKNGIHPLTLRARIERLDWDMEKAVTKKPQKRGELKEYIELAKKNGVGYNTFNRRVHRDGWNKKDAATYLPGTKPRPSTKWGEYLKIADQNGIPRATFYNRVMNYRMKWDPEVACRKPVAKKRKYQKRGVRACEKTFS